jgi:acyl dehydratase
MSETTSDKVVTTVEELKELIGQELSVGQWVEMTQERVNQFADVTGDHQYIHVDPERAKNTFFGGTIAHGYLTLSLMPLLGKDREGIRVDLGGKMAVNYGVDRVRFPAPVPVGKRIRMRSKLLEVNEIGDSAVQMKYQQTVEVEGQDKPGCVAETLSRIYF